MGKLVFSSWYLVVSIKHKLFLAFSILATSYLILATSAFAQLEIAETFDVPEEAIDGDVVSFIDGAVRLSDREYDDKIFGVIQTTPLVAYRRQDNTGLPVMRNGTVGLNVTTLNGPIKSGDYLTTSTIPGKAQKALVSGYVIGIALEDFGESDGEAVDFQMPGGVTRSARSGNINTAIKVEFAEIDTARNANRLLDAINAAFFRNVNDPEKFLNVIRYLLAGLAVLVAFVIGFFTLARTIPKGVEALGRNPLARNTIQFGMILNIIFTVAIGLVGVVAAIILLRF